MSTRKDLFVFFRDQYKKVSIRVTHEFREAIESSLMRLLDITSIGQDQEKFVVDFWRHVPTYWSESRSCAERMFKKHSKYFSKPLPSVTDQLENVEVGQPEPVLEDMDVDEAGPNHSKSYQSKSQRQQKRDVERLVEEHDGAKILDAAIKVLKAMGHLDAAVVVSQLIDNPMLGTKLRQASAQERLEPEQISPER